MNSTQDKKGGNIYEPINKYRQIGDHKDQLDDVLRYVQTASNYAIYKIQQYLPGAPVVCTYDPLVWLPPELLNKLLVYLGPASRTTLTCVSKSWNRYLTHHCIWHSARRQLGLSDSMFQSLGCAMNNATHPSWLAVTRAALSLYKRLQTKDAFFHKEVIPIQEATGISLSGPYQLTACSGLICQYAMHKWAVYDTTSNEILSRYAAGPDNRDRITCMRFVDSRDAPRYRPEGIIMYGNIMGDVYVALPFIEGTTHTEKAGAFHSAAVLCCDGDSELDLMASAAADASFAVGRLSTCARLFSHHTECDIHEVQIFPIKDDMYNIIAYGAGKCIQYRWPVGMTEEAWARKSRRPFRMSVFDYHLTPEMFHIFGDFLSYQAKELFAEDTIIAKVAHKFNSTIGCVDITPNEKGNKILVYDAYSLNLIRSAETRLKIGRLEAAGRRFALFTTTSWAILDRSISPSFKTEALVLFDLVTAQHLNYVILPCQSVSCFSTSIRRCTSYDMWWLDELPVKAALSSDWLEEASAVSGEEDEEHLSDSCSSLSSLSEASDAAGPAEASGPSQGAAAATHPLMYRPRPKSPFLYITYSNSEVYVITWKLAPQVKPKPLKTKQE